MFTGIVEGVGMIVNRHTFDSYDRLTIRIPNAEGLRRGASVSIHGVCLTATQINEADVDFDVIPETLARTTLGALNEGARVNVERSLKMGQELGGHLLSGHILETATVLNRIDREEGCDVFISTSHQTTRFLMEKGYIAVNGASLTIGKIEDSGFWLHLIPETMRLTTFDELQVGEKVNLEIDTMTQTIVNTVERFLSMKE